MKPRFYVISAGYDHAAYTEQHLMGTLRQKGDFDVFIDWTDDASPTLDAYNIARRLLGMGDSTHAGGQAVWKSREGFHITRRAERVGGIANIWPAIQRADDDDILVIAGADGDRLEDGALDLLKARYDDPDCWATYGTYQNSDGDVGPSYEWDGRDIRPHDFLWAPMTVRAWLAKKVFEEDLKMGSGKGAWWFPMGADVALNVPIMEMAGPEHARHIALPWFTRQLHPNNDSVVDANLQFFCNWQAYGKPRYGRLVKREDLPVRTPHVPRYSLLFQAGQPAPRAVAL